MTQHLPYCNFVVFCFPLSFLSRKGKENSSLKECLSVHVELLHTTPLPRTHTSTHTRTHTFLFLLFLLYHLFFHLSPSFPLWPRQHCYISIHRGELFGGGGLFPQPAGILELAVKLDWTLTGTSSTGYWEETRTIG